jgi:hypothetical protein
MTGLTTGRNVSCGHALGQEKFLLLVNLDRQVTDKIMTHRACIAAARLQAAAHIPLFCDIWQEMTLSTPKVHGLEYTSLINFRHWPLPVSHVAYRATAADGRSDVR